VAGKALKLHDPARAKSRNPPCPLVEGDAAPLTASEGPSEHDHCLVEFAELIGHDPILRPCGVNVSPELPHSVPDVIDDLLGSAHDRRVNLNAWVKNLGRSIGISIGERGEQGPDRLDVLTRHRLLGQTGCFEGCATVAVPLPSHDQPVMDRPKVCDPNLELRTTSLPAPCNAQEDHDLVFLPQKPLGLRH
jgi:hypothetical protein